MLAPRCHPAHWALSDAAAVLEYGAALFGCTWHAANSNSREALLGDGTAKFMRFRDSTVVCKHIAAVF